jgi:hypothetical protein
MRTLVGSLLDPAAGFRNPHDLMHLQRADWRQRLLAQGVEPDPQLLAVPVALGAWLRGGRRVVHMGPAVAQQLLAAPLPARLPPQQPLAVELVLVEPVPAAEPMHLQLPGHSPQQLPALVAGWLVWDDPDAGWSAIPHLLSGAPGGDGKLEAHASAPLALAQLLRDVLAAPAQRPDLQLLLAALVALCDERVAEFRPMPRTAHRAQRRKLQRAARQPTRWERLLLAPTADSVWRVRREDGRGRLPAPAGTAAPLQGAAAPERPERAPVALHSVRPTEAVVWVAQPRAGEQVLAMRRRKLGELVVDGEVVGERTSTLHAVRRPRAGHTRGSGSPVPQHQLLEPAG